MKWNITNKLNTLLLILITTITACNNNSNNTDLSNNDNGQAILKDSTTTITTPMNNVEKGSINNINSGCGYNYTIASNQIEIMTPNQREVDEIKKILTYSGIPLNFEIYSAKIENAIATVINNKRYIIYDPRLLAFTDTKSETYWSSMSILAHEIGHHLSGHLMGNSNNHQAELEADKFSGFVLYKMGASIEQSIKAMELLGSEFDSDTHPNKKSRIEAIENGWNEAFKLRFEGALPPPPEDFPSDLDGEFTKEMLWDSEVLNGWRKNYEYDDDFFTGIICDVLNNDDGSLNIQIYITETGNNWRKNVGNIDNVKLWFIVDNPSEGYEMPNVKLSWLEGIIVPGRKLKFAFIEEGSGSFKTISYLKPLPSR
jgi:hypothetical protein